MTASPIPVVVHGDPEAAVLARLVAIWADIDEPFAPAAESITTQIPLLLAEGTTAIQVQLETTIGQASFPARERSQVRVTCWSPKGRPTWAKALASRSLGELVASAPEARGTGQGSGFIRPQGGRSRVIQDPDTTNHAVWFLVTANLRGKQL